MNSSSTIRPLKPDPLAIPAVLTLELTEGQAAPFAQLGECFAVISKGHYPNHVGKWCLFALPVSKSVADAACMVAMGKARTARFNKASGPA